MRGRAKSARMKGRVEREARCIFDLVVGKLGNWMNLMGKRDWGLLLWIGCALKKGVDVQVLMSLVAQRSILRVYEDEDRLFAWYYCCWLCI